MHRVLQHVFWGLVSLCISVPAIAQEIEPRRWSHLPINHNFVAAGYAHTTGDISVDPTLGLENGTVELDTWLFSYIRTFELLDKSARIELRQPWQSGEWKGSLNGMPVAAQREGWGDTIARFAVNLVGSPPLEGEAYRDHRAKTPVETIVGTALLVQLPTGEYFEEKAINLGSNRYTFRPQLGVTHTRYDWSFEVTGAVSFFTDNDSFFNGHTLERDPLYTLDSHIIYTLRSGLWFAVSGGLGIGGRTTIDGRENNDRREDLGWAISAGLPITPWLGVKVAYIDSARRALVGNDSETIAVGLTASW